MLSRIWRISSGFIGLGGAGIRVTRWREDVIGPGGIVRRVQRSEVLGSVSEIRSEREAHNRLDALLSPINQGRRRPQSTMLFDRFVADQWEPAMADLLRPGSKRYYGVNIRVHLLPFFGSKRLCEIQRGEIQRFVADKRKQGYSGSSVHGMRTALSKVLQAAVDWGYLEQNPARGIRIGDRQPVTERLYLSAQETKQLLDALPEPIHTLVVLAVLTGMRIGELLALRWKNVDLLRGSIQVREMVSEGRFGLPKTRSSRRDVPMSESVRGALEKHRSRARQTGPEDLVFASRVQTPLNPKNLLRRVLRPACEGLGLPPISWHSFRHTHATLLGEVGESLRTAQAILGHSNLETTLNVYTHAIPESQRRPVDKVAEILFPSVPKFAVNPKNGSVN